MDQEDRESGGNPSAAFLESLDLQMQRLQIGNTCKHGLVPFAAAAGCEDFVATFNSEFTADQTRRVADCYQAAIYATRKKYADVWNDAAKMEWIVSAFIANGVDYFLKGDSRASSYHASFACFFEQWMALTLHQTQYSVDWGQICHLFYGEQQKLRDYLRDHTSCTCLV